MGEVAWRIGEVEGFDGGDNMFPEGEIGAQGNGLVGGCTSILVGEKGRDFAADRGGWVWCEAKAWEAGWSAIFIGDVHDETRDCVVLGYDSRFCEVKRSPLRDEVRFPDACFHPRQIIGICRDLIEHLEYVHQS